MNGETPLAREASSARNRHAALGAALFVVVALLGLYWAKWNPYYHKAFVAAHDHSLGASILGDRPGHGGPSLQAAWEYGVTYFKAIWKAFLVAVVLSSLVQVALPKDWIRRVLGKTSYGSTLAAGLVALPGMMCTCCAAPLVVGLRKQSSSVAAAVAFWFGNTALNPAVLVFMFFVLGWKFTLLRFIFGLILVFGLSYLAGRFAKEPADIQQMVESVEKPADESGPFVWRWLKTIVAVAATTVPAYVLSVLVLGGLRAWLFPAFSGHWGNSLLVVLLFAIVGTLFVIPTSAEIPIIQSLMLFGLGGGPAAVLAVTLPVISLPSALMVRKALSWRVLAFLGAGVAVLGFIAGLIGMVWIG